MRRDQQFLPGIPAPDPGLQQGHEQMESRRDDLSPQAGQGLHIHRDRRGTLRKDLRHWLPDDLLDAIRAGDYSSPNSI